MTKKLERSQRKYLPKWHWCWECKSKVRSCTHEYILTSSRPFSVQNSDWNGKTKWDVCKDGFYVIAETTSRRWAEKIATSLNKTTLRGERP